MSLKDREASVVRRRRPSTISKKNISEPSGPVLVKFNVSHHWFGRLTAFLEQIVSNLWFPWPQIAPIDLQWETPNKSSLKPQGS